MIRSRVIAREVYSFDINIESDALLDEISPLLLTNKSKETSTCTQNCDDNHNALIALLVYNSDIFVVHGGLFDHSLLIRSMTGQYRDIRLRAHRSQVVCIATSCDGAYLVTGSVDTTFIVW